MLYRGDDPQALLKTQRKNKLFSTMLTATVPYADYDAILKRQSTPYLQWKSQDSSLEGTFAFENHWSGILYRSFAYGFRQLKFEALQFSFTFAFPEFLTWPIQQHEALIYEKPVTYSQWMKKIWTTVQYTTLAFTYHTYLYYGKL